MNYAKKNFIIHTKMLGVLVWVFQKVNTFPKKQRFVLGQQIENSSLLCLRYIVEANDFRDKEVVRDKLERLNVELAILRDLLRVAYELEFVKLNSLIFITAEINEVGKMRGGWLKKL